MTRQPVRTSLHRPPLVRALADMIGAASSTSQPFAERMGEWLDFKDALSLFSVINGEAAAAGTEPSLSAATASADLHEMFERTRDELIASILDAGWRQREGDGRSAARSLERIERTAPAASVAEGEEEADFSTCHRHYVARQRDMTASIASLQATVRTVLAQQSAALQRLVALDTVLDQALTVRRANLLASVPRLLATRFEELRQRQSSGQPTDTGATIPPEGWLDTFCEEMQAVLLAELELRLQPVAGLIAALDDEVSNKRG